MLNKVDYFILFLQSNLLEMPAYILFLNKKKSKWTLFEKIVFISGLNAITHPIVFFIIMNLKFTYLQNILMAESFAFLSEAILLYFFLKETFIACLLISIFANFLSWQLAPMFTFIWGRHSI